MLKTASLLKRVCRLLVQPARHRPYPVHYEQFLTNMTNPPQTTCLTNGLSITTEERATTNTALGFFLDAGSRYENNFEYGIAHFFEHLAFTGTKARKKSVLVSQMSASGARFKCFTSREVVGYYVECLNEEVPLMVDILADCLFNSALLTDEVDLMKATVYKEMLDHDNNPTQMLYDYLHKTAFQGTPLANTVVGPACNLSSFTSKMVFNYLSRNFTPNRAGLVAVGGVTHTEIVNLACVYMDGLKAATAYGNAPCRFTGSEVRFRDDSHHVAHVAIAYEAPGYCGADKLTMEVVSQITNGWDRSQYGGRVQASRLGEALSSDPLCDAYKSFYIKYKDTGLWGLHFVAGPLQLDDAIFNIQEELLKLCATATDSEVQRARRQRKAKIIYKYSSCVGAMHAIARNVLYTGCCPPLAQRLRRLDQVTAERVRDACYHYLYDRCPVVAAFGPVEGLPEYTRIRSSGYWLRY